MTEKHVPPAVADFLVADYAQSVKSLYVEIKREEVEGMRARIAELEAHCVRLGRGGAERYWEGRWRDADAQIVDLVAHIERQDDAYALLSLDAGQKIEELEQQRGGVALPERVPGVEALGYSRIGLSNDGWNACLREVARLNPPGDGVNWKAVAGEQKTIIEGLQARLNPPGECVAVLRDVTESLRRFMRVFGCGEVRDGKALDAADDLLAQQGKAALTERQRKTDLFDQYALEAEKLGYSGIGEALDALEAQDFVAAAVKIAARQPDGVADVLMSALESVVHDERVPNVVSQECAAVLIEARRLKPPGECVSVRRELLALAVSIPSKASREATGRGIIARGRAQNEIRALLAQQGKPALVECDACPTSGGCVEVCMKAQQGKAGGDE